MNFFDLHCDTVYKCYFTGQGLLENSLALSFSKGRAIKKWCQSFALFIPDTYRGKQAVTLYSRLLSKFKSELAACRAYATECRTADEIIAVTNEGKCAALLTVENAAALGGSIEMLDRMHDDGVRMLTLTWNGDNELASGVGGSGGGLTEFGRAAVKRMSELGILCDVSHLNERGFWEVAQMGVTPLVATHSNFKYECDHRRNLTDSQFKAVCESGGLIGFNFYREFLSSTPFESLYANISHALELGGEDNIAFGSDFDGADIDFEINSVDKMNDLCDYLMSKRISQATLDKLFFYNALRMFGKEE